MNRGLPVPPPFSSSTCFIREPLGMSGAYVISVHVVFICLQLDSVDRFIFCVFLNTDLDLYESWMQVYFPSTDLTTTEPADASGE